MIVVEGPDGSGKSTLAKAIAEEFGLPIAPKIVNPNMETQVPSKKAWCENNVAQGFQATIYDRHCLISEPIYNSTTKSVFDPGFDDAMWYSAMMHMFYNHCTPLLIYCLPPYKVVRNNVLTGVVAQPKRVQEATRKLYGLYVAKAAADVATAGAMIWDYTRPSEKHLYRQIQGAVERMYHE